MTAADDSRASGGILQGHKTLGNGYFKSSQYEDAIVWYGEGIAAYHAAWVEVEVDAKINGDDLKWLEHFKRLNIVTLGQLYTNR